MKPVINLRDEKLRDMLDALCMRETGLPDGICICEANNASPDAAYLILICGEGEDIPDECTGENTYIIRRPVKISDFTETLHIISDKSGKSYAGRGRQIIYNGDERRVSFGDASVVLSSREAQLFAILYRRRGSAVRRDEIRNSLWAGVESNAVDVYVNYLRKKLRPILGDGAIVSIRGFGYMLAERQ